MSCQRYDMPLNFIVGFMLSALICSPHASAEPAPAVFLKAFYALDEPRFYCVPGPCGAGWIKGRRFADGGDFCKGRDIAGLAEHGDASAVGLRAANTDPALSFYRKFLDVPIPVIGAVQDSAYGMGCALAALCDITIAADTARFCVPEMDRDIPPGLVMSAFHDRVGRKAIAYLVYSGDEIDADRAQDFGIVSKVVPEANLAVEVNELATKISSNSMPSVRMVKELTTGLTAS